MNIAFLDKIGSTLDKQLLLGGVFPVLVGGFAIGGGLAVALGLEGVEAWYVGRSASTRWSSLTSSIIAIVLLALIFRVSRSAIQAVANTLNSRPRKTLGWKTPAEALDEYLRSVQ